MTEAEQALEARIARLELIVNQALATATTREQATLEIANTMLSTARTSTDIAEDALKKLEATVAILERMMPEQPKPKPPQIM